MPNRVQVQTLLKWALRTVWLCFANEPKIVIFLSLTSPWSYSHLWVPGDNSLILLLSSSRRLVHGTQQERHYHFDRSLLVQANWKFAQCITTVMNHGVYWGQVQAILDVSISEHPLFPWVMNFIVNITLGAQVQILSICLQTMSVVYRIRHYILPNQFSILSRTKPKLCLNTREISQYWKKANNRLLGISSNDKLFLSCSLLFFLSLLGTLTDWEYFSK